MTDDTNFDIAVVVIYVHCEESIQRHHISEGVVTVSGAKRGEAVAASVLLLELLHKKEGRSRPEYEVYGYAHNVQ
jgi:hypothetical protein